jgi:hypothetical protein
MGALSDRGIVALNNRCICSPLVRRVLGPTLPYYLAHPVRTWKSDEEAHKSEDVKGER